MPHAAARRAPLLVTTLLTLALAAGCSRNVPVEPDVPHVDALTPTSGPAGTRIQLTGRFAPDVALLLCDAPLTDVAVRASDADADWAPIASADDDTPYDRARGTVPDLPPGTTCPLTLVQDGVAPTPPDVADDAPAAPSFRVHAEPPHAPDTISVTDGDGRATLQVRVPDDRGRTIERYETTLSGSDAWTATDATEVREGVRALVLDGLTNGVTYAARVRAVNAVGSGAPSAWVTLAPYGPPGAVEDLVATVDATTITLTFTPPPPSGRPLTNLEVRLDDGPWTPLNPPRTDPPVTIPDRTGGTTYAVALRGVNEAGPGRPATLDAVTTAPAPPPDPPEPDPAPDPDPEPDPPTPDPPFDATLPRAGFHAIAAGTMHGLALTSNAALWSWGRNDVGQSARTNPDIAGTPTPTDVGVGGGVPLVQVAAGERSGVARDADGRVWTWGQDLVGQRGRTPAVDPWAASLTDAPWGADVSITDVAASGYHVLALDDTGRVWAWGNGATGRLGNGGTTNATTPTPTTPAWSDAGHTITDVATFGAFSLARDATGNLWSWGANDHGQLGQGTTSTGLTPGPVDRDWAGASAAVTAMAAGGRHALAVDANGVVWTWGDNAHGQLAQDTGLSQIPFPIPVTSTLAGVPIVAVAAGTDHSLALDDQGRVWAWGRNLEGQVGIGGRDAAVTTPTRVDAQAWEAHGVSITDVAAGPAHSLAIDTEGRIWGWGDGSSWQLTPDAHPDGVTTPVKLTEVAP